VIIDTNRPRSGQRPSTRVGCNVTTTVPVGDVAAGTVCVYMGMDEVPGWHRLVTLDGIELRKLFGREFIETQP